jgi:hypothetical protein
MTCAIQTVPCDQRRPAPSPARRDRRQGRRGGPRSRRDGPPSTGRHHRPIPRCRRPRPSRRRRRDRRGPHRRGGHRGRREVRPDRRRGQQRRPRATGRRRGSIRRGRVFGPRQKPSPPSWRNWASPSPSWNRLLPDRLPRCVQPAHRGNDHRRLCRDRRRDAHHRDGREPRQARRSGQGRGSDSPHRGRCRPPLRIQLGRDAYAAGAKKLQVVAAEQATWHDLSVSTDHDDVTSG